MNVYVLGACDSGGGNDSELFMSTGEVERAEMDKFKSDKIKIYIIINLLSSSLFLSK